MDRDSILNRLDALDVCALSDALDKLGLPPSESGLLPRSVVGRISGRVKTVKLAAAVPGVVARRHLCTAAIVSASPGDVIVVEQRTGLNAAGWGGVLSNAAQIAGIRGAIVEGPARDIDEARDIGFPVYSREMTARTARGRVAEVETGGVIEVGGVKVSEGDYVAIDASGAAFIASAHIVGVLEVAEQIAHREGRMTQDVRAGKSVESVMSTDYETMLSGDSIAF